MTRPGVDCWVVEPGEDLDLGCLATGERQQAADMGSPTARRRYAAGRATLRHVLAGCLGTAPAAVPLAPDRGAAPRLVDGTPLHLGLAHAGPYVAVAVSRSRVGVDLEVVGAHRRVPGTRSSPAKLRTVAHLVGDRVADETLWVVQEAALKADGVGLAFPLDRVLVTSFASGLRVELVGRGVWGVTVLAPRDRVVMAVAVDGPPPALALHRLPSFGARVPPDSGLSHTSVSASSVLASRSRSRPPAATSSMRMV